LSLEPSLQEIFEYILPKYVSSLVYRILLGSIASEHVARMIAMDIATKNADDMIKSLTLTMNKLRQASITKELLEIITATEALKV
jgi:F-type H+-transporting ATPase subunit gamma